MAFMPRLRHDYCRDPKHDPTGTRDPRSRRSGDRRFVDAHGPAPGRGTAALSADDRRRLVGYLADRRAWAAAVPEARPAPAQGRAALGSAGAAQPLRME